MYYVPDETRICGFYECSRCHERFLDVKTAPLIMCPYCEKEPDMEIGPDDPMPEITETAELIQILEGEDIERYDTLLSLAVTGGNYDWI